MIGLQCDTCDGSLVLTVGVAKGQLVVTRHPHTECSCPHPHEELVSIVEDAYQYEM